MLGSMDLLVLGQSEKHYLHCICAFDIEFNVNFKCDNIATRRHPKSFEDHEMKENSRMIGF